MSTARYTRKHSALKSEVRRQCQGRSVAALHRAAARAVFGRAAVKQGGGTRVSATIPEPVESNQVATYRVTNVKTRKSLDFKTTDSYAAKLLAIDAGLARKIENLTVTHLAVSDA